MESVHGIGRMSRESGLTISALRFYDAAGVLGPARVDPHNGYRYYAPDQLPAARLVAVLRRVGMPLAGIRRVLDHRHDPDAVDALLAAHVTRLEQGLADARRALSSVPALLRTEETPMTTCTVPGPDLAAALRAVRFAVSVDPEFPVLGGILVEIGTDAVTVVATDRFRLAVARIALTGRTGPAVGAVVPAALADALTELPDGPVTIIVDGRDVTIGSVRGVTLDGDFPDFRRLLPAPATGVPIEAATVRDAGHRPMRRDGVRYPLLVVSPGADGGLEIGTDAAPDGVGVNAEFLLQALDAAGPGPRYLHLDGPITPLVIRSTTSTSLLMPVRLD